MAKSKVMKQFRNQNEIKKLIVLCWRKIASRSTHTLTHTHKWVAKMKGNNKMSKRRFNDLNDDVQIRSKRRKKNRKKKKRRKRSIILLSITCMCCCSDSSHPMNDIHKMGVMKNSQPTTRKTKKKKRQNNIEKKIERRMRRKTEECGEISLVVYSIDKKKIVFLFSFSLLPVGCLIFTFTFLVDASKCEMKKLHIQHCRKEIVTKDASLALIFFFISLFVSVYSWWQMHLALNFRNDFLVSSILVFFSSCWWTMKWRNCIHNNTCL